MIDMSYLSAAQMFWDEWRFLPWSDQTASGLYRRVDFIKAGIIGEVGRYVADDYIIWSYNDDDLSRIFHSAKPAENLMLQRFIFLKPDGETEYKSRSFWLGLRGFAEMYQYSPLKSRPKQIKDLGYLIDCAHQYLLQSQKNSESAIDSNAGE